LAEEVMDDLFVAIVVNVMRQRLNTRSMASIMALMAVEVLMDEAVDWH
jgi:hypothetical protein